MVTFGRHPFVRLVSTYKDKVIDGLHPSYRKMMNYDENHPYSVKYFSTFQLSVPICIFIVPIYLNLKKPLVITQKYSDLLWENIVL